MTKLASPIGRSVEEWIGSSPDAKIPDRVKLRVWARCEGKCAITGRKLRPGDDHDFDHILPLALGGEHAERNLQLVSREAHKVKTADDRKMLSKADRVRAKHLGIYPPSKAKIKSRGFAKTRSV